MLSDEKIEVNLETIDSIASNYIKEGRQKESWSIDSIEISGKVAIMYASMTSIYNPNNLKDNFHLSIFIAEEMASQLMIIYGHIRANLKEKKDEVWMLESSTKSIKSVTNSKNIKVELNLKGMRKVGESIYGMANFFITDENGGIIEIYQKGILT